MCQALLEIMEPEINEIVESKVLEEDPRNYSNEKQLWEL